MFVPFKTASPCESRYIESISSILNEVGGVGERSEMSSEQVCYVNCNFCNTILLVNIPSENSENVVTVRCELCANLLSVNLEVLLGKFPLHNLQNPNSLGGARSMQYYTDCESSSSKCSRLSVNITPVDFVQHQMQLIQPTEKRRVPSAYNRFIKEEIRRLKAKDPNISHKEAFSTAAKNWAHFPEIHFGLSIKGNNEQV